MNIRTLKLLFLGILVAILITNTGQREVEPSKDSDSATSIIGIGVENITSYLPIENNTDNYNEIIESRGWDSTTSSIILTVENYTYVLAIGNSTDQNNVSSESEQITSLTESNIFDKSETSLKPTNNIPMWGAIAVLLIIYSGGLFMAHNMSESKARKKTFNPQI